MKFPSGQLLRGVRSLIQQLTFNLYKTLCTITIVRTTLEIKRENTLEIRRLIKDLEKDKKAAKKSADQELKARTEAEEKLAQIEDKKNTIKIKTPEVFDIECEAFKLELNSFTTRLKELEKQASLSPEKKRKFLDTVQSLSSHMDEVVDDFFAVPE